MHTLFKAGVLAVLISICSTEAFADESAPTVSEAHDFLREQMSDWVSIGEFKKSYFHYSGSGCQSSWQETSEYHMQDLSKKVKSNLSIDWRKIYDVQLVREVNVVLSGSINVDNQVEFSDGTNGDNSNTIVFWDLLSANPVIAKRVSHAMTLLMTSCQNKSKFD
jgi:hypothetical protein